MHNTNAHAHYARTLRALLPPEAFLRRPALCWYFAAHVCIILAAGVVTRIAPPGYALLMGLVAGHSFACISFFAHELSHGSVLRHGLMRSLLQTIAWGMLFIPSTLWDEVHNHVHHIHTNTAKDPDRRWTQAEASPSIVAYTHVLYPHAKTVRWNPLVFAQFFGYILRNIIAALSGGHLGMLPAKPNYTTRQRLSIAAELVAIASFQSLILWGLDWNWWKWLGLILFGQVIASAVVMTYVFTHHFLNPLQDENDPLAASTSVAVPRIVDWLHLHMSYHTEHHLFPSFDHRFCPLLSQRLQETFPHKYNRIPITVAWQRLWKGNPYSAKQMADTTHA